MGRRAALLLVAVLVAAAGTSLVFLYVQGISSRATAGHKPVQVLTASAQIEAGETMAAAQASGKLDLAEWPAAKVLPGALGSTAGYRDRVALADIYPGEQIIPQKFGDSGTQEVLAIPKGRMAISVELTDPNRVAGFVNPGSNVAVFVTAKPEPTGAAAMAPPTVSQLLLREALVLGVGQTTVLSTTQTSADGAATTEEIPKTILTLAVTQDDAEKVLLSAHTGELAFALLNEDSLTRGSDGTTLKDVLDGGLQ